MKRRSSTGKRITGLSKKNGQEKRTFMFVDEAGFYLLPMMVRTSAPRGQTPVQRVEITRNHLAVIGGITPTGIPLGIKDTVCAKDVTTTCGSRMLKRHADPVSRWDLPRTPPLKASVLEL